MLPKPGERIPGSSSGAALSALREAADRESLFSSAFKPSAAGLSAERIRTVRELPS